MLRLVNTLAGGAAFLALAVAVWRDYGLLAGVRRAGLAYLAVFVVAALLALVVRSGVLAEDAAGHGAGRRPPEGPPADGPATAGRRPKESTPAR